MTHLVTVLVLGLQVAAPTPSAPAQVVVKELASGMGFVEGPVWLPSEQKLVFSDIPRGLLLEWSAEHGVRERAARAQPNGNLLDLEGRLLTCQHAARNVVRHEADGTLRVLAERFEGRRLNSPNDLALRSDGTLWFTDPPWGLEAQTEEKELPGHWVFRLDLATGALAVALRDLTMPNGIAFSPDESRLYVADTGGHPSHPDPAHRARPARIHAYAVDEHGELAPERVWSIEARCDGMCVDTEGRLYTTAPDAIAIFLPDGSEAGRIELSEAPTNACFGGADRRTLFVTARTRLFAIELEATGCKPIGAQW